MNVSPGTSITGAPANLSQTGGVINNNNAVAAQAQADATTAYGIANGLASTGTILNQLGGQTLGPGVYDFTLGTTVNLDGLLTLDAGGDASALFVIRVPSDLVTGTGGYMNMLGGADSCNVIWTIGSSASLLGPTFDGTILALASITLGEGVTVDGRLLAQTGNVTLIGDTINTHSDCQPGEGTGDHHTENVPDSGNTLLLLSGLTILLPFRRRIASLV